MSPSPFEPYHAQIKTDIKSRISSGEWPVDSQLPSTRKLTDLYHHLLGARSSSNVRQAIKELTREGILRSHKGAGVWVARLPD